MTQIVLKVLHEHSALSEIVSLVKIMDYRFRTNFVLKDVRAQKFPRTDFFKTLAVGRK